MPAGYEVRITPLLRGIPGSLETDGGVTTITEAETTVVTQFSDLEVVHELNEPRTARVTLSLFDETLLAGSAVPGSLIASLEPYQQALWIAFKRPGEEMAEAVFWGQCNVITDYEAGTVTLEGQDPSLRCQHHYIRRGDAALNLEDDRGRLEAHAASIDYIIEAARNIMEQQDREVPALGLYTSYFGNFTSPAVEDAPFIEYERGQECWDLIQQVVRSVTGPDMDMSTFPAWFFPLNDGAYTEMDLYDPAGDGSAPAANTELGRNLDPADPDDPQAGEVIFDYGAGLGNLTNVVESPGRPTTHVHVVDADKAYRVTSADADSSYDVGVFVDWVEADFKIPRAEADTTPLRELGEARIKAYGRPPKFFTCTLHPDDAQPHHYGHPNWHFYVPPGIEYIGGDWYIGDFVRVRALRGYRSFSTLARIVGVKLKQEGSDGLPILEVSMIPAVGGTPGADFEDLGGAFVGGGTGAPGTPTPGEGDGTTVGGGGSTGLILPSGEPMPDADLPGWRLIFADDFDTDIALGSFPAADADNWYAYPAGWQDTSRNGRYDAPRVVSVHDGMMDMYLHTDTVDGATKHLVAAPVPLLPGDDPAVYNGSSPWRGMQYGRYAVRFRADAIPGYKTAWLLWPLSDVWPRDGEIDFPEGDLGATDTIWAFMHRQNGSSGSDQDAANSGEVYDDWHTAVLEWGPTECRFELDGVELMAPTSRIPNTPMRWVLQTETQLSGGAPSSAVSGHVYVDWVAVWAYDP